MLHWLHWALLIIVVGGIAALALAFKKEKEEPVRQFNFQEPTPQVRYCADCGKEINPRAEICPHCGVRQYSAPAKQAFRYTPNRIVAGLLAILVVGGFGAHKFYMGQAGKGLLYLCTFWTFIPFIVAFFQGIRYLLMSDEDFEEQYWH